MNNIAVVICNYNKKDYVLACINSVLQSSFMDFDLVVVDNASTDGSVEAISENFGSELTLLVNDANTGGAGGFNRGMQYAMDREYRYIHLLDNDVIVDKDAIGELYRFMEANPKAGACGSLICRMDEPDFIQDFGSMIDLENLGVKPLYSSQRTSDDLPEYVECDYVAACSAMYRANTLRKTGIIDKDFFIYWDDMALSWEIRLAGYKICACKKSIIWHYHGLADETSTFGIYYFFRNKVHCFAKYCGDEDYNKLCANLVTRLFRTFAVNRDRPEKIFTYFHALNDALNGIRGKADSYKIVPLPSVNTKFVEAFLNKASILLICGTYDFEFDILIRRIENVSNGKLSILPSGFDVPIKEGVHYVATADFEQYDAVVYYCPHILDEGKYNRQYLYIDRYMNQILNDEDFDFFQNLDANYAFFRGVFFDFIKSKLDTLRKKVRLRDCE